MEDGETLIGFQNTRRFINTKREETTMKCQCIVIDYPSKVMIQRKGALQTPEKKMVYNITRITSLRPVLLRFPRRNLSDGATTENLWNFMMLLFRVAGKSNIYFLTAVRLDAVLTPREAHSLC